MRYLVTGGAGFLGRPLVCKLRQQGHDVLTPPSAECNLMNLDETVRYLQAARPDRIVHSAAYYGGLGINGVEPATIYFRNLIMGAHVFEASRQTGSVEKVIVIGTACSYPGGLENLMSEAEFWTGPVHPSVENYGMTKKIMSVQGRAYLKQYGLQSIHVVLTNLFGPWDSYNPHRSHVVAALIRKFVEAAESRAPAVHLWGTGQPVREFLYVDDCADGIVEAADRYEDSELPLNIGTGVGTSIRELSETIARLTGFEGSLVWEADKPDGQPVKVLDPTRARHLLRWRPAHTLEEGLAKTIAWYVGHKAEADARW